MSGTLKEKMVNFHIAVMKKGLINEGDRKWNEGYLPKIKELAEKTFDEMFNQSPEQ